MSANVWYPVRMKRSLPLRAIIFLTAMIVIIIAVYIAVFSAYTQQQTRSRNAVDIEVTSIHLTLEATLFP